MGTSGPSPGSIARRVVGWQTPLLVLSPVGVQSGGSYVDERPVKAYAADHFLEVLDPVVGVCLVPIGNLETV